MIERKLKNQSDLARFKEELAGCKEPHTLLFISDDSFLSTKLMDVFAQAVFCRDLCDECLNCKKLLSGNHPDVMYFPTKAQLLVEDSEKIVSESFVRPIFASKKIFIIRDFDRSTPEAQNKLLKIFEEPDENVYYFLSTTCLEKVLPTIRSRCFKLQIPRLKRSEIEGEILANCDKPLVLELGKGNLGKTLEFSRMKELNEIFGLVKSLFKDMKHSRQVVMFASKILAKKEHINLIMEMCSLILEDILLKLCKKEELITLQTQMPYFESTASDYTVKGVCEIEKLIRKVLEEMNFNVNLPAMMDNFLLGILEVKYLCK